MRKAQTERFKQNKISKLIYNIWMKKYQEKLQKIRQELPVLESRLTKKIKQEQKIKTNEEQQK